MDFLSIFPALKPYVPYVTAAVASSSALAVALPAPSGTGLYAKFYAGVNWIALNFGHAKNASAP